MQVKNVTEKRLRCSKHIKYPKKKAGGTEATGPSLDDYLQAIFDGSHDGARGRVKDRGVIFQA